MKKTKRIATVLILAAVLLVLAAIMLSACDLKMYKPQHFDEDTYFYIDFSRVHIMNDTISSAIAGFYGAAIDVNNTYFLFGEDGTVHGQIKTKDNLIGIIQPLLPSFGLDLTSIDLSEGLKNYVEPMFPGFTDCLKNADLEGALLLAKRTIGLNIEGFDYEDEGVKEILEYIAENMSLPPFLFDNLPEDTALTITFDARYVMKEVEGSDGEKHTAIYIGDDDTVADRNDQTNALTTFSLTDSEDGTYREIELVIEFMQVDIFMTDIRLKN